MNNVLLLKGESQYNAMRNYIDEIEIGFRLAGYNTYVIDVTEKSYMFQVEELLSSVKIDITFTCNAILKKQLSDISITYLTDHPAVHGNRLKSLDDRTVVFVCDRRHEAYIRRYCPNIRYVKYIPLSGETFGNCIPYRERSRDVLFTGSYTAPEEAYKKIFCCDETLHEIAGYMAKSMTEQPEQDLEMCLRHCLSDFNTELSDWKFHDMMQEFTWIEIYARNYHRDRMIRNLVEAGQKVHVFGDGWEAFEGQGKENLIIEKGNFYIAGKAVTDAKISLNIMPWFKDGFQERIAAAMLSGTVAVTDESKYIQENFTNGKDLVLYALEHLEELPSKVNWLLEHPDEAERIAQAGKERAERELTWQHRTFEMLRCVQEWFSLPIPQRGKYGEIQQIAYRRLHESQMLGDAINNMNEIIDMISQVKLYDKMELCDIDYFYTKFLSQYVKISANYPEISMSDLVYNMLTNLSENQVKEGTELLILECMHMLAAFLAMENSELRKHNDLLQEQVRQADMRPNSFSRQVLLRKMKINYQESEDEDIQEIMRNIERDQRVEVYSQNFSDKYCRDLTDILQTVQYDAKAEMYFVPWNGRNMYYPKGYTREQVTLAVNFVYMEQDMQSPHRYLDDTFYVQEGDVVIDAGVAEGNFALDIADKARKIYLVECEHKWAEALRKTFEPWKEKVVIIEKMLSDTDNEQYASIDGFVEEGYVNFLKLDVEGAEIPSLRGADKILTDSKNIRCAVCSYHRRNAERDIREFLENYGFTTSTTKGYMFFHEDLDDWADGELRHGIVRAVKLDEKGNG